MLDDEVKVGAVGLSHFVVALVELGLGHIVAHPCQHTQAVEEACGVIVASQWPQAIALGERADGIGGDAGCGEELSRGRRHDGSEQNSGRNKYDVLRSTDDRLRRSNRRS